MGFNPFLPYVVLCGVLTLAIYISPNNGLINLLPTEKMIFHVFATHFCTLHHVSWTIIDEVTVPVSKGLVGSWVG
jgi:hypothetical protein